MKTLTLNSEIFRVPRLVSDPVVLAFKGAHQTDCIEIKPVYAACLSQALPGFSTKRSGSSRCSIQPSACKPGRLRGFMGMALTRTRGVPEIEDLGVGV